MGLAFGEWSADRSGNVMDAHRATVISRHAPPRPRAAVQRPELFDRLDAGIRAPLTLITGPAGAGKTVLLTTWLTSRLPARPVGWISLEARDGRYTRFWSELLNLIGEVADAGAIGLPDPAQIGGGDFIGTLAHALDSLSEPVVIVLDDFEQLHSQRIASDVDQLLRGRPGGLRIVIASRRDPGLSLQRLRLEGLLTEIRSTDLALTPEQAVELFAVAGVTVTADQVRQLHERTEGWIAGLSLAALSLRGHPDPDEFVRTFAGDERTVADYLVEEVLHQQPAELREFMLRTSIVDAIEPGLADALTGRNDGARVLEALHRSNGFLLPVSERRHRYRYHPMFMELLRSQLRYRMPDLFVLEHRRAARWFAANGSATHAVRHAMTAGDLAIATDLLREHWLSLLVNGNADDLATWVDGLPRRMVSDSPELAIASAGAALDLGNHDYALSFLGLADARAGLVPAKRRARFALSRSVVKMLQARTEGNFREVRNAAHKVYAGQQLAGVSGELRALAALHLGVAAEWLLTEGGGVPRLEEALELAGRGCGEYIAVGCLSHLAMFRALAGALREAESCARRAIPVALRNGWDERGTIAPAYLALSLVEFQRARLDVAREDLSRAARAAGYSPESTIRCLIDLARSALTASVDLPEAVRIARSARGLAGERRLPQALAVRARLLEASGLAELGESEAARAISVESWLTAAAPVECSLIRARLSLADHAPADALRTLGPSFGGDARPLDPASTIEALALASACKHLLHDDAGALDLLEEALSSAQQEGHRRPLLIVGSPLPELLKRRIRAGTSQRALVGDLIETLEQQRGAIRGHTADAHHQLLDPLSDREEAVLRYLPTVMSKAEIAAELFVSVNTVKTHTKNIYRKLGVGTRTEAVRRAKRLNLV